jgi:hypothetical protein
LEVELGLRGARLSPAPPHPGAGLRGRRRPPGHGLETFTVECAEGTITVVGTPGDSASRWVDDQHMVQLLITFTPTGGAEIVAKAYGQKTGLAADAVTCTVTLPDGTAKVVRVPVPPGG